MDQMLFAAFGFELAAGGSCSCVPSGAEENHDGQIRLAAFSKTPDSLVFRRISYSGIWPCSRAFVQFSSPFLVRQPDVETEIQKTGKGT
jgi:hypothetical protein